MSDRIITPIAEAIVDLLEGIRLAAHLWEPKDLAPPAGAVGVPTLKRTPPDEAESQLGADDWNLDFTVSLYFDLVDAAKTQQAMADALSAFTAAVDADRSLGGTAFDASVTEAVPFVEKDRKRPLAGYEVTVAVVRLV